MDYNIILPLMVSVIISTVVARRLSRETIYTLKLLRRGVDVHRILEASPIRTVTVSESMTRNFPTVPPTMTISEMVAKSQKTGRQGFPVVDEQDNLCGMVTLSDVESAMSAGSPEGLTVGDICAKSVVSAYPDQYLHELLVKVGAQDLGRIPVVERNNPKHLVGVLQRQDITRAYIKAVTDKSRH
jgi:CIC family chloride channel protein